MTEYATPPADAPPMGGPDDDEAARWDQATELDLDIKRELRSLRARDAARAIYATERAANETIPPFDAGLLTDILARPEAPAHRAEGIIPADAGTLIVAQRKTGKTTLQLNLARCLIDGEDFLGRFPTTAITGRVAFLNFEVSAAQLARWAADVGVPGDRLFLVNLRGRRNPLSHPRDREQLATKLRALDVESLIVDPFGRAFSGTSQNDSGEVGSWLSELDIFARGEVGARDVILAAHAGWNGERSRGSTALEDWADSIVTITRDDDQTRYLRADGRDVSVDEDQLTYNAATRTLGLAGAGSRKSAAKTRQVDALLGPVLELLRDTPSMTGNAIDKALRELIDSGDLDAKLTKGDGTKAAQILERRGMVASKAGARNARYFTLITSPTSLNLPEGNSGDFPDFPSIGGGRQGKSQPHPTSPNQGTHDQEST